MIGEVCHTSESVNIKSKVSLMDTNLDNPEERYINTVIHNYVMAEFVAIPPDFDLQSHLSMREQVGIYEVKNMNLTQANLFVDSIKSSSVFCSMNNALINPNICFFVLQLFQELGLIMKSVYNPMRHGMSDEIYMSWAKRWETGRHNHIRGQEALRISFLIVNVVHLLNDELYNEVVKTVEEVSKFQKEIDSMNYKLD
jgi:hypothetical protein